MSLEISNKLKELIELKLKNRPVSLKDIEPYIQHYKEESLLEDEGIIEDFIHAHINQVVMMRGVIPEDFTDIARCSSCKKSLPVSKKFKGEVSFCPWCIVRINGGKLPSMKDFGEFVKKRKNSNSLTENSNNNKTRIINKVVTTGSKKEINCDESIDTSEWRADIKKLVGAQDEYIGEEIYPGIYMPFHVADTNWILKRIMHNGVAIESRVIGYTKTWRRVFDQSEKDIRKIGDARKAANQWLEENKNGEEVFYS